MRSLIALVTETDPDQRRLISTALKGGGFHVVEVDEPPSVSTRAVECAPDLVLLDLDLDDDAAWEIISALSGHEVTCEIPVIALSSGDRLCEATKLWNAGFCGYLKKPVAYAPLLAAVRFCLAQTAAGEDWVDLSVF
jgi:DNA-binding response OmpR family regulator